jgi:hypothetical protein
VRRKVRANKRLFKLIGVALPEFGGILVAFSPDNFVPMIMG